MRILYAGLEYARGVEPKEGSIEHINFYLPLAALSGIDVCSYSLERAEEIGMREASYELRDRVRNERPDVLMVVSFNHDLDKRAFSEIRTKTDTKILGIFFDEDTDLYERSLPWAPYLDWILTFYPPAYREYKKRGYNVIGRDWFVNTDFYKPAPNVRRDIDVSFVGGAKPERRALVGRLAREGVSVAVYGPGWPRGPVSFQKMIEIFNRSKVNLNFGAAKSIWHVRTLGRIFAGPKEGGGMQSDLLNIPAHVKTVFQRRRPQSRARPFEIAACRGFLITNPAPLFEPLRDREEVVYARRAQDLPRAIRHYLEYGEEREAIASRAYARIRKRHDAATELTSILRTVADSPRTQ